MLSRVKFFFTLVFFVASTFVLLSNIVWSWTNPVESPPGGSGAIMVDAIGRVGIGTSAPAAKLDINGNIIINNGEWYLGYNSNGNSQPAIRSRGMGYNPNSYPGVQVGQVGDHVALFVDPGSIPGGAVFNGNVNEVMIPNVLTFIQANGLGTNWLAGMTMNNGNVGIGTSAPANKLDVNGGGTIRGILDLVSNKIINVALPTNGTDVANKDYVDAAVNNSATTGRIWGEGRPNVGLMDIGENCTNTVNGQTISISRGDRIAHWDGAAAVCPAGWWVCSANERGTQACGTTNSHWIRCYASDTADEYRVSSGDDAVNEPLTNEAWVSDARPIGGDNALRAPTVTRGGVSGSKYLCSTLPAWCCSY